MVKLEKILLIKKEFQDGKSKSQIADDLGLDWNLGFPGFTLFDIFYVLCNPFFKESYTFNDSLSLVFW